MSDFNSFAESFLLSFFSSFSVTYLQQITLFPGFNVCKWSVEIRDVRGGLFSAGSGRDKGKNLRGGAGQKNA